MQLHLNYQVHLLLVVPQQIRRKKNEITFFFCNYRSEGFQKGGYGVIFFWHGVGEPVESERMHGMGGTGVVFGLQLAV